MADDQVMIIGTETGLLVQNKSEAPDGRSFTRVLNLDQITHIEILAHYSMIILVSGIDLV